MKIKIKRYPLFLKRVVIASIFISLVFSCSKKTDTPTDKSLKFCGSVDWKSTLGITGYFKGALVSGTWGLTSVNITDDTPQTLTFNRDGSGHILSDNLSDKYTYDKDNLVKIVLGTATGQITFKFDNDSHLIESHVQNQENSNTSELTMTYTYDSNGDPVKITGLGVTTSGSETSTANYDITADYLTDKTNFLPLVPEIAPFSVNFAYSWFLSQHLINKWKINIVIHAGDKVYNSDITSQYTYTYDADGRVSTMSHSANNTFTFTYSDCK